MKRLALIADEASLDNERAIANFLGEQQIGFWHRMQNAWLLIVEDDQNLEQLRDAIVRVGGTAPNYLLMEVQDYCFFAPQTWLDWFAKHWHADPKTFQATDQATEKRTQLVDVNAA